MSKEPTIYQIKVDSQLSEQWQMWFDHMTLTQTEDGGTLLTGLVEDQAALHGLLRKVRDLGLPLISVVQMQPDDLKKAH